MIAPRAVGARFRENTAARIAPELFLISAALLYAVVEGGRWVSPLGDFGVWMSDLEALGRGGRAMREVPLVYGPGSLWILRAACRLFGSRVATLAGLDFLAGLGAGVLCVRFSSRFLARRIRWVVAVVIAGLVYFMPGYGCLLYPYAPAAPLALVLLLGALHLGVPVAGGPTPARHAAAFLLASGCYLTKQEVGIAAVLGLAGTAIAAYGWRRGIAIASRGIILFALGVAGGYALCLHGESFSRLARENHLWPFFSPPRSLVQLNLAFTGMDEPVRMLRGIAAGGALLVLAATAAILLWGRDPAGGPAPRPVLVAAVAGVVVGLAVILAGERAFSTLAAAPLLLLPEAARCWRWRTTAPRRIALLCSAAPLLLRAGFRGSAQGPFLGLGVLLAIPLLVESIARLPETLAGHRREIRALRRGWTMAMLALAVIFAGSRGIELHSAHSDLVAMDTPRGRIWLPQRWGGAFRDIGGWLTTSPAKEPVALLPETNGLDFLFGRRNASPSPDLWGMDDRLEGTILAQWTSDPPALAVVFDHPSPVPGGPRFGREFGLRLTDWISRRLERAGPPREWPIAYSIYRRPEDSNR